MYRPAETTFETSPVYPGWRVTLAAIFGVMAGYAVLIPYTFSLFLKPLTLSFGWRRDQISIAFACVALTVAVCAPAMGWFLDRFGPRRVVLPCTLLFGLVFASLSLQTPSLIRFYVTFVALGVFANGTTQLAYSRAVSSWFFTRRGLALSLISAGAGVGSMTLPLLAAWLIQKYGWRTAYRDLGLVVIAAGIPLAAVFLRENVAAGTTQAVKRKKSPLPRFTRPYLFLVAAILLYSITFNGVISHFASLLTDRGLSLRTAAEAISVIGICGFMGRLGTGLVLDRFFAPRISLLLFLVTIASVLLLCIPGTATAFAAAALLGLAAGGESDITPYLLSRYFKLENFSLLYGIAWTAFAAGTAIGPVLTGKLYSLTGSYPAWGLCLLALPTLGSAILMGRMPAYAETSAIAALAEVLPSPACSGA